MASVIMCDRSECITSVPAGTRPMVPAGWRQAGSEAASKMYCSDRCLVLDYGGVWPDDPVTAAVQASDLSALAGMTDRSLRLQALDAMLQARIEPVEEPVIEPEPEPEPIEPVEKGRS